MDGWKIDAPTSRSLGSAGFSADVYTAYMRSGGLSWTLQWTEQGRWLGYNVEVKIEPQNEA